MRTLPAAAGTLHAECATAVAETARVLESLGHAVEESHPEALDDPAGGEHFTIMYATNMASMLQAVGFLAGRDLGEADVDPLNWGLAEMGRVVSATQFIAAVDWIHGFTRRVAAWWQSGYDLLLTSTLSEPPPPLGTFCPRAQDPLVAGMRASVYAASTSPFNMTGAPAISLPLHWSPDGLPIGMQLVADYGREDLLLQVAAQLERRQPWAERRPPLGT
jgi:amidase